MTAPIATLPPHGGLPAEPPTPGGAAPGAAPRLAAAPAAARWRARRGPRRLGGLVVVAVAHGLLGLVALRLGWLPMPLAQAAPLSVALLDPSEPTPQPAPPRPEPRPHPVEPPPLAAPAPVPVVVVEAPPVSTPLDTAAPSPTAPAAAAPAPAAAAAEPAPTRPIAPPAPARRSLSADAVAYRVQPPAEVPRASRRAGESGTVWLRVVVDVQGLPAQVSLHRSSGFPRLDEQALWAMRQARFKPHLEDGRPIEVEVIAAIEYPAS